MLRENARNKYQNLPEDEEEIRKTYGRDAHQNMTQNEKNRLKKYHKKKAKKRKHNLLSTQSLMLPIFS